MYNRAMSLSPLTASFYNRPVLEVTRALIGMRLVRLIDGARVGGYITEAEAYAGESDLACHARAGRTPRTAVMYGPPGRAYLYFIYGMHWMFNIVAEEEGSPSAILVRAMLPSEGLEIIASRRGHVKPADWTNGPARLCMALDLDGKCNGADLTDPRGELIVEPSEPIPDSLVIAGPRVGIDSVPEPWLSKPWRLRVDTKVWEPSRSLPINTLNPHFSASAGLHSL